MVMSHYFSHQRLLILHFKGVNSVSLPSNMQDTVPYTYQQGPALEIYHLLPAGCHGNLTILNLLHASVAKNQHFRSYRKNYALDRKMIGTF